MASPTSSFEATPADLLAKRRSDNHRARAPLNWIRLSVQGCILFLDRTFILSHDWILPKLFTSSLSFELHRGTVFIDVDAAAFRFIVSVLKRITTIDAVTMARLTTTDIQLILSAARYLMCWEIVQCIEGLDALTDQQLDSVELLIDNVDIAGAMLTSQRVPLSVRGAVVFLDRDFIEGHDWILARMFTSPDLFKDDRGAVAVDADPESFRVIVAVLKGVIRPEAMPAMTAIDSALLLSTACDLQCPVVVDVIEGVDEQQDEV